MHGSINSQPRTVSQARTHRRFGDPDLLPDPPRKPRTRNGKTWKPDRRAKWRKQIKRILNVHYGYPLPNDDAGRESFALLCHAAFAELPPKTLERVVTQTAAMWADWMAKPELAALIDEVTNRPRRDLNRKKIGIELGLTRDVQMRPDIKAYDIWPVEFRYKDWKQWKAKTARERAVRNRAKKRQGKTATTKTAQAIAFLQDVLANGPLPVADILRLATGAGLEKPGAIRRSKPMREACDALGIVRHKKGMETGWSWSLPETQNTAQVIDISEGAMFSPDRPKTPYFSEGAILRSPTSLRGISERRDGRIDVVADPDPGWSGAAVDGPHQDHADVPRARMARAARPEFAAIRLPCTERFTINVTSEFRAMMKRRLTGIAQIGGCFPRTGVSGWGMER